MDKGRFLATQLILSTILAGAGIGAYAAAFAETLWGREFVRSDADQSIYYLDHRSAEERIEVTVVSNIEPDIAEQMIAEKVFLFGSLFERQRVGYPGQYTKFIDCPAEFKPRYGEKEVKGGVLRYFRGFASKRFAFGACDAESAAYAAVNAYLYCPHELLMYDIGYFSIIRNDAATQEFIDTVDCSR